MHTFESLKDKSLEELTAIKKKSADELAFVRQKKWDLIAAILFYQKQIIEETP